MYDLTPNSTSLFGRKVFVISHEKLELEFQGKEVNKKVRLNNGTHQYNRSMQITLVASLQSMLRAQLDSIQNNINLKCFQKQYKIPQFQDYAIFISFYIQQMCLERLKQLTNTKIFKLISGICGIYTFYLINSILTESLIKKPYLNTSTGQQQTFQYSIAFAIFPCGFAYLFGFIFNKLNESTNNIPLKNVLLCSSMVLISTFTLNVAIYQTSFPVVEMVKSCNLVSIVMVGVFCSRVRSKQLKLGKSKIIVAIIVTIGIILFNVFNPENKTQNNKNIILGVIFLGISLLADGFLPDFQAQIKEVYKPKPMEMFQQINKWVFILALVFSIIVKFQISPIIVFMFRHPIFTLHMIVISVVTTIGQIFVYRMIKQFKQHVVPFVITTRKILTVLMSIIIYDHQTSILQFIGIMIVLLTVIIEFIIEITNEQQIQHIKQTQQNNNAQIQFVEENQERKESKN